MPAPLIWPAVVSTVMCFDTSICTSTLLEPLVMPCVTPTLTPLATYLPALTAAAPAEGEPPPAPTGSGEVPTAVEGWLPGMPGCEASDGMLLNALLAVLEEPKLRRSRPRPERILSSTPGPPPPVASAAAACAICRPCAALILLTLVPNSTRDRISSCGSSGCEESAILGCVAVPVILTIAVTSVD